MSDTTDVELGTLLAAPRAENGSDAAATDSSGRKSKTGSKKSTLRSSKKSKKSNASDATLNVAESGALEALSDSEKGNAQSVANRKMSASDPHALRESEDPFKVNIIIIIILNFTFFKPYIFVFAECSEAKKTSAKSCFRYD